MIRLFVVDDQELIRTGISALLDAVEGFTVLPPCGSGQEALTRAAGDQPDIILMDIRMPEMTGLEAIAALTEQGFEGRVLLLTTFYEPELVQEGLRLGAAGYLLKDIERDQLIRSIETAHAGGMVFDESVAAALVQPQRSGGSVEPLTEDLTPREIELLQLVSQGKTNKEIADETGLSEGTVRNYISTILAKLGVDNRTRAIVRAMDLRLI